MTRSLKLLEGHHISHRFVTGDDLPEQLTAEEIHAGALHAFLPAPGQDENSTVTVCLTSGGRPVVEFLVSCLNTERTRGPGRIEWVVIPNGPYMDQGRNRTAYTAMVAHQSEWLLTLDDDLQFTPEDIENLIQWAIEHRIHVAGGVYGSPHDGKTFAVAYRTDESGDGYVDLTTDEIDAMDPNDPKTCQVAAVGTGFLLVHRSVMEVMRFIYSPPQPWYAELTVPMPDPRSEQDETIGTHLGEDLTFCRRLWSIGIPVHLAPHIRMIHYKTLGITLPPHPRVAG